MCAILSYNLSVRLYLAIDPAVDRLRATSSIRVYSSEKVISYYSASTSAVVSNWRYQDPRFSPAAARGSPENNFDFGAF